ncbi:hypothetical protein J0677_25430, partial [Vibrio parahaemolyticus]|uniref:hypothetical protein n=1 Tax=Vibrio parahaemolyticus TaxID=670 RepID=UPI001A8FA135
GQGLLLDLRVKRRPVSTIMMARCQLCLGHDSASLCWITSLLCVAARPSTEEQIKHAEEAAGFEAAFRLHVSSAFAIIKAR